MGRSTVGVHLYCSNCNPEYNFFVCLDCILISGSCVLSYILWPLFCFSRRKATPAQASRTRGPSSTHTSLATRKAGLPWRWCGRPSRIRLCLQWCQAACHRGADGLSPRTCHWKLTSLESKSLYRTIQWSLYFKTTHGTMKLWSYIAGGPKIKVQWYTNMHFGIKIGGLINKVILQ